MKRLLSLFILSAATLASADTKLPPAETRGSRAASPQVALEVKKIASPRSGELRLVTFDRKRTRLRVLDLPPASSVAQHLRKSGALAGVNGGYFQPNHEPLGLVVSDGVKLNPMTRSKLLSGVFVVTPKRALLLRRGEYREGRNTREALQAGPFLVDRGKAVAGLNATKEAERTVLLANSEGVFGLLTTQAISLADLAQLLATRDLFPGQPIERALNLDGGSSTALWVAASPGHNAYSRPEWKRVRNAVAVFPRD